MKLNWTLYALIAMVLLFSTSCDEAKLLDENKDLPGQEWYYKNKLVFDVHIDDTNKTYNIFLNLRVGNDYKYNNFFLMVHQTSPSQKHTKERKEVVLIDESGNWLGHGLGDLYDFQVPIYPQYRFKEKGIYHFELEQNMREDTVAHLYAAGMRIEDFSKVNK